MKNEELLQKTAEILTHLKDERVELKEKIARYELSLSLIKSLAKTGTYDAEELIEKYEELNEKTAEDLGMIKKAMDFSGTNFSLFKIGSISEDKTTPETPEDIFLNYLLS